MFQTGDLKHLWIFCEIEIELNARNYQIPKDILSKLDYELNLGS